MANTINLVLEALLAEETPNMPAELAEDKLAQRRHRLISALQTKLEGHPDAAAMLQRYRENPAVWEGVLAEALVQANLGDDAELAELARETLRQYRPFDPDSQADQDAPDLSSLL